MAKGTLFVGTSGFAYKEWKGNFYPADTPDKKMLEAYSKILPSVEINYTFRRLPSENTVTTWKSQTPEDFKITLKASQRITHYKQLNNTQEDVDEFIRRARLLDSRLGVILFQLPPSFQFDQERLETFLAGLPPLFKYAMEFRHESWKEPKALELLEMHGIALCGVDWDEARLEKVPTTASHVYLRLRREKYLDDEINVWAERLKVVLKEGRDAYVYFKHEGGDTGHQFATLLRDAKV